MSYLRIFVFVFVTLMSFNLFAQLNEASDATDVEDQYSQLEDVMFNTSNQFIYSFFGKEMLLYYLNDPIEIEAVKSASESDLINLSAPFNTIYGKFFMGGLTVIYLLTIAYFVARAAFFALENGWLLQKSGTSYMDKDEFKAFAIKTVLIGSLIFVPIKLSNDLVSDTFYTNGITALFFDALGIAHEIGDDALGELIMDQKQNLSTLALPALDSKWDAGIEINRFFACTRLDESRENKSAQNQKLELYRTSNDLVEGVLVSGKCTLSISFGFDYKSDKKLELIKKKQKDLSLPDSLFYQAQKEVFVNVLTKVFTNALSSSDALTKRSTSSSRLDNDFTLSGKTSKELTVFELNNWVSHCDDDYKWSPTTSRISTPDRVTHHLITSRCLSKDMTQLLLYPDSYEAIDSFLDNASSTRKQIAMCVDNSLIGESGRFVGRYKLTGTSQASSALIEEVALDSCIMDMCSSNSLNGGGLYACSNALDLYESRMRDMQIKERGTMMLGFYMFNLFIHNPPSSEAKGIYNKLSFSFDDSGVGAIAQEKQPFASLNVAIPEVKQDTYQYQRIMSDLNYDRKDTTLPTIDVPERTSYLGDLFGFERLATCAKNPLQIADGYVCNNIPKEFSKFGFELLQSAVVAKTILVMGSTWNDIKRFRKEGTTITPGKGNNAKSKGQAIKGFLATPLSMLGNSGAFDEIVSTVSGVGFTSTDEFGNLNTRSVDGLMTVPAVATIVALTTSGPDSFFVKGLDALLSFMLVLGIFFAFVIPLVPMIFIISALAKFMFLLMKTLLLQGFKLVDGIFDNDQDLLSEKVDEVWADWLATCLKLPLTVVGVVLAWLMSNVVIAHVLRHMDMTFITNDGTQGLMDLTISLFFSLAIIFIIYNMILSVIESFYDFTIEWILQHMTNSPFSDSKAIQWKDAQDILRTLGR